MNLKLSKAKFNLAVSFKDHLSPEYGGRPSDAMLPCARPFACSRDYSRPTAWLQGLISPPVLHLHRLLYPR